jgi:hypothetical protein
MLRQTWNGVAASLAPFILMTAGAAAAGADGPGAKNPGLEGLPADAARMYGLVKTPHPGELRWQQIPWLTDLGEGIMLAKEEKRPLVLCVSGDDPLEKC